MRTARAFAPASVANFGVGFDVLGAALDGPGDTLTARVSICQRYIGCVEDGSFTDPAWHKSASSVVPAVRYLVALLPGPLAGAWCMRRLHRLIRP